MAKIILVTLSVIAVLSTSPAHAKRWTIAECIDYALEHNASLITARNDLRMAKAGVKGAWANFLPHLDSDAAYYYTRKGPSPYPSIDWRTGEFYTAGTEETTSETYSLSLSLSQQIFNQELMALVRQRKADRRAMESWLKTVEQNLALSVKQSYYDLLKTERLLEVQREAVKRSREQMRAIRGMVEVGKSPPSDSLKVKVQLGTDRLNLITAQNNLRLARSNLNHLIGLDVGAPTEVVDDLDVSDAEMDYQASLAQALQEHPSVKQAMAEVTGAEAQVSSAKGGRVPTFHAGLSYSWDHEKFSEIENLLDRDYSWSIYGRFDIPIFDGLATKANIQSAKAHLNSAEENLHQTRRDIELEVQQAFFSLDEARERIAVANESLTSAEEDLNLAQTRYQVGVGTILELLDAQVSYSRSKSQQVEALYDYKLARAKVEKALGHPIR